MTAYTETSAEYTTREYTPEIRERQRDLERHYRKAFDEYRFSQDRAVRIRERALATMGLARRTLDELEADYTLRAVSTPHGMVETLNLLPTKAEYDAHRAMLREESMKSQSKRLDRDLERLEYRLQDEQRDNQRMLDAIAEYKASGDRKALLHRFDTSRYSSTAALDLPRLYAAIEVALRWKLADDGEWVI